MYHVTVVKVRTRQHQKIFGRCDIFLTKDKNPAVPAIWMLAGRPGALTINHGAAVTKLTIISGSFSHDATVTASKI